MQFAIQLHGLEKSYSPGLFRRPVQALRGLNLNVGLGELYGIVGTNGSGKTTTFQIILGLLKASSGSGTVLGCPLGDRSARGRLGFLPELPAYYSHLDGGEILRFARSLSAVGRDDQKDRELLERLGIGQAYDRRVGKLSKGQLQRVGLAQALVHEPELIILDEPMSGLDPVARNRVKELLLERRAAGCTVVLSTHVLTDIESLADRIGLIQDGVMLQEGTTTELLSGTPREVRIEGDGVAAATLVRDLPASATVVGESTWTITLDSPEPLQVDATLRTVLSSGGRVLQVQTLREDLESRFLRSVEEAKRCA